MPHTITLDPVTRLEGHLKVSAVINEDGRVSEAATAGNLFRDFENILRNRGARDAALLTQRICGVCPISHAIAAAKAVEAAVGFEPAAQAVLLRNLIQGSNFIASHVLHFYHLASMDFARGPAMSPWSPHYDQDLRLTPAQNEQVAQGYLEALQVRRKAHEMGALLAGKLPHAASILPGGVTTIPTAQDLARFGALLQEIQRFVHDFYRRDLTTIAAAYPEYADIGAGPGNFLSFGLFGDRTPLLPAGVFLDGRAEPLDLAAIREDVARSWYAPEGAAHPTQGTTEPAFGKEGAYSWIKAPRYRGLPMETGPLARAWVAGTYRRGTSVMDRHWARLLETERIIAAMREWLQSVNPGVSAYTHLADRQSGSGVGLTEAPRGALGHWTTLADGLVMHYQILTPTCWNCSPRDSTGRPGPLEQALAGVQVSNTERPVELLRIVHSYDPCTACAVHVMEPGRDCAGDVETFS